MYNIGFGVSGLNGEDGSVKGGCSVEEVLLGADKANGGSNEESL
jgi:hypothetical protein